MSWESEYVWVTGDEVPSPSQTKKAGDRIRRAVEAGEEPRPEDLQLLDRLRAWHGLVHNDFQLRLGEAIVRELGGSTAEGLTIVGRPLKTREAIIAKLVREKSRLNRIQDIVGARVLVPDLDTQATVLEIVLREFADCSATVTKDTRDEPDELGYRGLHVVVRIASRFAEIQIRTPAQGLWAQVVEKLDERAGTDLKHGVGPAEALEWLKSLSDGLNRVEHGQKGDLKTITDSVLAILFLVLGPQDQ